MKKPISQTAARPRTFAEQMTAVAADTTRRAFERAEAISTLAKASKGRQKAALYREKHRILQTLIGRRVVDVAMDADSQIGLLSVRLPNGRRLHTSEAWLEAASVGRNTVG